MAILSRVAGKLKPFIKSSYFIYPLIVVISIPLLLVINTLWNLKTFNRDVNFLIRHQAISIADTLKPVVKENIKEGKSIDKLINTAVESNPDIVAVATFINEGGNLEVVSTSADNSTTQVMKNSDLNNFALGSNQSFAGLNYDPIVGGNVWDVSVPLGEIDGRDALMVFKMSVSSVDEILARTTRDSYIVLAILVFVTAALLVNHFIFYRRAAKAKQLAELDRLKDEFISMAAHELKAPITGLTGYLEMLREKIAPNMTDDTKKYLDTLDTLTVDLKNLINDLLDVSRIEQGRVKLEKSKVQVNDVISKVVNTLAPTASQKNISIIFTPVELPEIETDPDKVRQVIVNLLSNSIKFTLEGKIEITASKTGKDIKITVSDTGIGIPPDDLSKLFKKFHRVKDEKTSQVRGTGLGLWITKQIVELLEGDIRVQSIYGKGTQVTFTLPIS